MLIAIALFDRFTALDAVGPFQVLVQLPNAKTIFVSERPRDVTDESGVLTLRAEASFADVPHPDIILVPGGPGQAAHMGDDSPLRDWLIAADQPITLQYIAEVTAADTHALIAGEKAGIIKCGVPCFSGVEHPEAFPVIEWVARQRQAPLTRASPARCSRLNPSA